VRIPSRDLVLAGVLHCPSKEVETSAWQAHLVKHPLGIQAIARSAGRSPWSTEGWDKLDPPVITEAQRGALVRSISALSSGKLRCEVPELRGKKSGSNPDQPACYACRPPIVFQCERLCAGLGARYAAVTQELLAELAGEAGISISRDAFLRRMYALFRAPADVAGLSVLTFGVDGRRRASAIARMNRLDGVRS
jgi:hypothetical protein